MHGRGGYWLGRAKEGAPLSNYGWQQQANAEPWQEASAGSAMHIWLFFTTAYITSGDPMAKLRWCPQAVLILNCEKSVLLLLLLAPNLFSRQHPPSGCR